MLNVYDDDGNLIGLYNNGVMRDWNWSLASIPLPNVIIRRGGNETPHPFTNEKFIYFRDIDEDDSRFISVPSKMGTNILVYGTLKYGFPLNGYMKFSHLLERNYITPEKDYILTASLPWNEIPQLMKVDENVKGFQIIGDLYHVPEGHRDTIDDLEYCYELTKLHTHPEYGDVSAYLRPYYNEASISKEVKVIDDALIWDPYSQIKETQKFGV